MAVNRDKPDQWKADVAASVDMYNAWFMEFAPKAFRETRIAATKDVEATLRSTENITNVKPAIIRHHPEVLPTLRMSTCPPLAVDRLIGLARVSPGGRRHQTWRDAARHVQLSPERSGKTRRRPQDHQHSGRCRDQTEECERGRLASFHRGQICRRFHQHQQTPQRGSDEDPAASQQ